jgi:hypothetical protein
MRKDLRKTWSTVAWVALVSIVVFGHGWAGRVEAQGTVDDEKILAIVRTLQTTLASQQTTLNTMQKTLTDIQTTLGHLPHATQKKYYQTKSTHPGNTALAACATGYHMASLWEIFDTNSLTYDTTQPDANTGADTGAGPPSGTVGWMRTGNPVAEGAYMLGSANCDAWTNGTTSYGTIAQLTTAWDAPG